MKNPIIPAVRDRDGMAVIGRTLHDLRNIRFDEGEGGNTPPAVPVPPPPAPPAPTPTPAPTPPAPVPPASPPAAPAPINYKGDPDEYVRELRAENKTAREAREAAETAAATAAAERETAAAERDNLKRENTVILRASELGAKAAALLDSKEFTTTFATVDLADKAAVDKAITDALEKNSAFRSGPALPPSSGGGHQGGQPSATPPSLANAVKTALGG